MGRLASVEVGHLANDGRREYDGNNRLVRKYIYGPGVDQPVCMIDVNDADAAYYYHFDGLGSVIALSDADGNTAVVYEYDVYGRVAASDPNHPNPFLFTARRFDTETGLYYYRARYYNATIGRFLQTDPIGYTDGMSLYAYCGNNPIVYTDSEGLFHNFFLNGKSDPDHMEVIASLKRVRDACDRRIKECADFLANPACTAHDPSDCPLGKEVEKVRGILLKIRDGIDSPTQIMVWQWGGLPAGTDARYYSPRRWPFFRFPTIRFNDDWWLNDEGDRIRDADWDRTIIHELAHHYGIPQKNDEKFNTTLLSASSFEQMILVKLWSTSAFVYLRQGCFKKPEAES